MELRRDGATINYEAWGDLAGAGRWVMLVNGHTRPLNDFRMLGRNLAERGFRVLALDNRGAGKTDVSRDFTLTDMVDDVVALLDEHAVGEASVAGISMGGFISQTMAVTYPERVARLALISTAASQAKIVLDERPWSTDLADVGVKMAPYFTAEFAKRNDVLVKSMMKQIVKAVEEGKFAERSEMQRRAVKGFDMRNRLDLVRCPTLIVHGVEDAIIPIAAGEELAGLIPTSRLETVKAAGHLLLAEKPRELYQLIGDFFSA